MAVIDGLADVRVTVRINHQDVVEYNDPNKEANDQANRRSGAQASGPRTINKFIECVSNAEYSIYMSVGSQYSFSDPHHSLNFAIYIDGEWRKGEICRYFNATSVPWEIVSTGRVIKKGPARYVLQPFTFRSVRTVDDDDYLRIDNDSQKAKDLGVIEVRVHRVVEQCTASRFAPGLPNDEGALELAERSLKGAAISHGTQFGEGSLFTGTVPGADNEPRYANCSPIHSDNGPIGIFRFIYRSRAALIAEAIIPRGPDDPSPWGTGNTIVRSRSATVDNIPTGEIPGVDIASLTERYNRLRDMRQSECNDSEGLFVSPNRSDAGSVSESRRGDREKTQLPQASRKTEHHRVQELVGLETEDRRAKPELSEAAGTASISHPCKKSWIEGKLVDVIDLVEED